MLQVKSCSTNHQWLGSLSIEQDQLSAADIHPDTLIALRDLDIEVWGSCCRFIWRERCQLEWDPDQPITDDSMLLSRSRCEEQGGRAILPWLSSRRIANSRNRQCRKGHVCMSTVTVRCQPDELGNFSACMTLFVLPIDKQWARDRTSADFKARKSRWCFTFQLSMVVSKSDGVKQNTSNNTGWYRRLLRDFYSDNSEVVPCGAVLWSTGPSEVDPF